eukprot:CAMPEP_0119342312 /NCGR_PEP_ID=MMETSP1333-20130426/104463_1 /TAXON_ID=418940 /ORGANISM="Scyphosphaera apsteinii, Strain RCC1455" /LENGTH=53 /DNA_ID=CAMNT_0007354501 /DNA_START=243 /DNA_END=404 /DNA_ORIENTATION=+
MITRHQLRVILIDQILCRRFRLRAWDRLTARDQNGSAERRAKWPAETTEEGRD